MLLTAGLGVLAGTPPPGHRPPQALPEPDSRDYAADLRASLAGCRGELAREIATGDANEYIDAALFLHGMVAAVEATGDTALMDEILEDVDRMIAKARPLIRKGIAYQEWGPWDGNGNPPQLATFAATGALARVAAVLAGRPEFHIRYRAQQDRITAFIEQSIFRYWFDRSTGVYADPRSPWPAGQIPWLSKDLGGWGSYGYFTQPAMHLAMVAAWMYRATGNPRYRDAATRLAKGFRNALVTQGGHWIWDPGKYGFEQPDNQEGCQDTSHANRIPMMMVSLHEAGIEFTRADLRKLGRTFLDAIWNGSDTDPRFANYIDGSDKPYRKERRPGGNGIIYHGWAMLGRYSPEVQRVLALSYERIRRGGPLNPSLESNASPWARVELAGTLALNLRPPS